ncbi:hypothetical protein EMIHUDRAFT_244250 [Emiliania huxleyi CCMP1516]|uniref:Neurotransmitter-gated ion-channel ligand-binding domain-containing protein n=2 Tax=Emiliania huxleyi TaxID=2903 RepID=A0A0D3J153_EMIH1|nr:hypothetical protein EMIHUDRAFT_244250 [Emiliania huxleyi CCMP1516]EOD17238.1 hypothetical protein EMIHUDRAFT_244250 [Emiliania huxleyi CCMP1516]|eukprot:XP_005769667.1 hypothetical protein EMIHUDRAFT_244250 [Emiliania huxleyi CCMP1516]
MRFCLLSLLSAASVHAQGYPEAPETAIYPERFSPTTDIVSFSPAAWLMQPYHPLTPKPARAQLNTFEWFGPGNSLYGLHSMVLMSRACKLEMGEPDTCYFPLKSWGEKGSPFDHVHSDSTDARYTFVREDSLTRADSWNPFCVYNGIDGGCGRGSRNSWTREVAEWPNVSWPPKYSGGPCNSTGVLGAYAQYGAYYHMADQMFSNCRWTVNESQAAGYIREVAARTNDRGESYDYSFEVCQWPGDCTTETGNCINAYSAVFLADLRYTDATSLLAVPQEEDFFPVPPRQYPPMGAGRIEMVYSTAINGPHLPCSVDDDGQQLPCGVPGAEAEEEDLVIHISKLKVNKVKAVSPAEFTVVVEVTATWTSKYAVHPCGIDLYRGVVAGRANIPAKDWWRPIVEADGAISSEERFFSGNPMLQVQRTPGNATHEPEPVKQPCTSESCAWRAQVYLQEDVLLEMTFKSDFNLNRYPFDTQTLTGSFFLAEKFDGPDKVSRTSISFDSPGFSLSGLHGDGLEGIYTKSGWTPRSAVIRPSSSGSPGGNCRKEGLSHLCADFEIRLERVASGNVFKVLVPVFVQMGITTLAAMQPAGTRLQVLALGAVASAALMMPRSLGLPADIEGVPFVMALVICHITVVAVMLVVTGYQILCSSRRAALVGEWKAAFAAKRALEEQLPGGAPHPAAADVSLSLSTGEPLRAGKEAEGYASAQSRPAEPAEPVSLLTRAVLALPALMHHANQSTLPKPTHPHGEGSMGDSDWIRAEDKVLLARSGKIDTRMAMMLPPLYILLVSLLLGLYWGGAMDKA